MNGKTWKPSFARLARFLDIVATAAHVRRSRRANDQIEYHINFTGEETIVGFLEGKIQRILYVYFMMRSNTVAGSTRLSTIPKRWMGEPTV